MRTSAHRLGASAPQPAPSFVEGAQQLETFARGVVATISDSLAAAAVLERDGYGRFVAPVDAATFDRLLRFVRAYRELEAGRASVQPYQLPGEPVRFAVIKTGSQLGWWPIALKVIQLAGTAALSGAGVYLTDAWLDARNADATANKLRAETEQALATLAAQLKSSGDTAGASRLAESVARASAAGTEAARSGDTSWVDSFKVAAAGATTGAALIFAALYFLSRRKKGRR